MANKGWEDVFNEFYRKAEMTWDQVNHGFIDETCMSAKERAEIEARFEALEARVEALENKESHDTGEFIDGDTRASAVGENLRWETSWRSPDYYPGEWTYRDGNIYDSGGVVINDEFLKEFGFRKIGRWVSEWRDL